MGQKQDGRMTVLVNRFEGRRLNSPNDLVVAQDGAIWFTDPVFGVTGKKKGECALPEQRRRFVFRIGPGGALAMVFDRFEQPNGIAFSPDGRALYVSETDMGLDLEGARESMRPTWSTASGSPGSGYSRGSTTVSRTGLRAMPMAGSMWRPRSPR